MANNSVQVPRHCLVTVISSLGELGEKNKQLEMELELIKKLLDEERVKFSKANKKLEMELMESNKKYKKLQEKYNFDKNKIQKIFQTVEEITKKGIVIFY